MSKKKKEEAGGGKIKKKEKASVHHPKWGKEVMRLNQGKQPNRSHWSVFIIWENGSRDFIVSELYRKRNWCRNGVNSVTLSMKCYQNADSLVS